MNTGTHYRWFEIMNTGTHYRWFEIMNTGTNYRWFERAKHVLHRNNCMKSGLHMFNSYSNQVHDYAMRKV
jgi:hypothetical protein